MLVHVSLHIETDIETKQVSVSGIAWSTGVHVFSADERC